MGIILLLSIGSGTTLAAQHKVGWLEEVLVNDSDFTLMAKIDTGADNSSINAPAVEVTHREGKKWARFTVTNKKGQDIEIEKPIVRVAHIKTKDGRLQPRNVIEIDVCLSGIRKSVPVNLIDRSHFRYQMLIGRSFLNPDFLVDSSQKFLIKPSCS